VEGETRLEGGDHVLHLPGSAVAPRCIMDLRRTGGQERSGQQGRKSSMGRDSRADLKLLFLLIQFTL
jgi:hypothetical protein